MREREGERKRERRPRRSTPFGQPVKRTSRRSPPPRCGVGLGSRDKLPCCPLSVGRHWPARSVAVRRCALYADARGRCASLARFSVLSACGAPLPPVAWMRCSLLAVYDAFNACSPSRWSPSCAPSHSVRQPADPVQLLRPPVVGSPPELWCSLCLWSCASLGL